MRNNELYCLKNFFDIIYGHFKFRYVKITRIYIDSSKNFNFFPEFEFKF